MDVAYPAMGDSVTERLLGARYRVDSVVRAYGAIDEKSLDQLSNCLAVEAGARGVLCADHHLGYSMPIGGVVAYRGLVSPSAVGFDIACGNAALCLGVPWREVAGDFEQAEALAQHIASHLAFGVGRRGGDDAEMPSAVESMATPFQRSLLDKARAQFGTIGSGNHYVDLFEDADGVAWVGVHFGSRGFGYLTAQHYLAEAGARSADMMAPPCVLPADSPLGIEYIEAMTAAGRYAYAARVWVIRKVAALVLGEESASRIEFVEPTEDISDGVVRGECGTYVHNHHNFAWYEAHGNAAWWVHRKGATPAWPGQFGFVGASMGEAAAIVVGNDTNESRLAMRSTVHGAGRVMSRREAAGKTREMKMWRCACGNNEDADGSARLSWKASAPPVCERCSGQMYRFRGQRVVAPGRVEWPSVRMRLAMAEIALVGGGADEAPECYKRLDEVLAAHGDAISTVLRLKPRIVLMAGDGERDPYKD